MTDDNHNINDVAGNGMTKDEAMEAMGELYREGKVDMVPVLGDVDPEEQPFTMTEKGEQYTREMFKESDDAVLFLIGLVLKDNEPFRSERELARTLIEFADKFVDDVGVNPLRVINRNVEDLPFLNQKLPDELVEHYDVDDQEESDDEG